MGEVREVDIQEALRTKIRPGSKIYGVRRKTGKQGERLYFDVFFVNHIGEIERITRYVAFLCGFKWSDSAQCIYMDGGNFNKLDRVVEELGIKLEDGSGRYNLTCEWL
jgi:hypothetical protein